jgi:ferritin-like metal-binding protein YciE
MPMSHSSLHDLYVEGLRDLYHAEGQLAKILPRLAKAADAKELRAAFDGHIAVTRAQVERLNQIFAALGVKASRHASPLVAGLIEIAKEAASRDAPPPVRDAALIGAGQRAAHFAMAEYECARTYARLLGHEEAAELLQECLDEEAEADLQLTELAQSVVLLEAEDKEPAAGKKNAKR